MENRIGWGTRFFEASESGNAYIKTYRSHWNAIWNFYNRNKVKSLERKIPKPVNPKISKEESEMIRRQKISESLIITNQFDEGKAIKKEAIKNKLIKL